MANAKQPTHTTKQGKAEKTAAQDARAMAQPEALPPGQPPAAGGAPAANPGASASPGAAADPGTNGSQAASTPDTGEQRFVELPMDTFSQNVAQIRNLLGQIRALIPNPTRYTPEQRRHSGGRLKENEGAMLRKVLAVARKYPAAFESLAGVDFGVDPTTFEVDLVDDRLTKSDLLSGVVDEITSTVQDLSDCMLELNETGRQPALGVYVMAKGMAKGNPIVSGMIADTVAYYAATAKAAAATRQAKQTAKAAATPPPAPAPATPTKTG